MVFKVWVMEIVIMFLSLALGKVLHDHNKRFKDFIDKEDY